MSPDLKARALREYGSLAGVSERTDAEERWAQRLYGLLTALGEDVWEPEPRADHRYEDYDRDQALEVRLSALLRDLRTEG